MRCYAYGIRKDSNLCFVRYIVGVKLSFAVSIYCDLLDV